MGKKKNHERNLHQRTRHADTQPARSGGRPTNVRHASASATRSKAMATGRKPAPRRDLQAPAVRMSHDVGGLPAGTIDRSEHDMAAWESSIDATVRCLIEYCGARVDELRRSIEALSPKDYCRLSYYERWVAAAVNIAISRGVLTSEEIVRRVDAIWRRRA